MSEVPGEMVNGAKEKDHASYLLKKAVDLIHGNRIQNALDILRLALDRDPRSHRAYALLGSLYEQAGDTGSALISFRKAVQYGAPRDIFYERTLNSWELDRRRNKPDQYRSVNEYINNNPKYALYDIGDYSYCPTQDLDIGNWFTGETLIIGKFCSIATGVTILLGGEHPLQAPSTYNFKIGFHDYTDYKDCFSKGDVHIGNDVLIGYGATILSGVHIGDGAVVGAKSVVTKDIKPYGIAAGNPAKIIGQRFSDTIAMRLIQIRWWDWDHDKIKENIPLLVDADRIGEFIERHSG